jgi:hypothetical protein
MIKLTKAQQKALNWVYQGRGEWMNKAGRLHAALQSLGFARKDFIECRTGNFGKRGGYEVQWRITPVGSDYYESQTHAQ